MASLTLKGIPEELLDELRELAESERRSLTQEAIHLLEESIIERRERDAKRQSASRQAQAWRQLAGRWQSSRTVDEDIEDIYDARTAGRDVEL